ncbi:hypothetical protein P170DRAFT_478121 [Aspergillus steynii IBT 23096]|uniref:EF-hand domain-containing protein n=1 Tax=Aspergillus steynii IBT 23096 TaxID=1392250 RepID=A0A2I2G333_9EURO|nr:uncharacterized protein P170DRAFT_478121 [Aspergillus steynii IBT 23096]PLB47267.1 hypothetical protein P170DRAFT_478121 [Aspergillus steynii IBT 23096]
MSRSSQNMGINLVCHVNEKNPPKSTRTRTTMAVSIQVYNNALAQIKELELDRSISEKEKLAEKTLRPLFEQVLKKKNPDNAVYSLDAIQDWLLYFFSADKDSNGYVSAKEFVDACQDENQKQVADFFKFSDANSDARISFSEWVIMGFICAEQESGYGRAKKD